MMNVEVQRLIDEGADVNEPSQSTWDHSSTSGCHWWPCSCHGQASGTWCQHGGTYQRWLWMSAICNFLERTPLHNAAKEKNKKAVHFLLENGAFLPPDMTDGRFNPPLHYCPGLEWAYKLRNKLLVDAAKKQ
ncbi:unnamed protein product [Sphagnum troendelagicum]|uniref:Uncharacterized protein n=1 Tax=Sphagnum jensenii TaxID=128206 RepID=A0ABP0X4V0_9BRYO